MPPTPRVIKDFLSYFVAIVNEDDDNDNDDDNNDDNDISVDDNDVDDDSDGGIKKTFSMKTNDPYKSLAAKIRLKTNQKIASMSLPNVFY